MTLYKTSTIDKQILVSQSVYICECGYTEIKDENNDEDQSKVCPKCSGKFVLVSSSTEDIVKEAETESQFLDS